ncbi:MAG TPA: HAD family hydrolase [Candidatus Acidoferrales bacterium]|nr:HAD family hydrolase [Candidatus Acidoferrales bacterium]
MTFNPAVIIFDVDGVLVDTRGSFQRTTLETVEFFAGKRVTRRELHRWKNRPGFNDDWKLSTAWVKALGKNIGYEEVKRKFVELYWGENGQGNVAQEKWLLPAANLRRLSKLAELDIFTGRIRRELDYTLKRWGVRDFFRKIVSVENVKRPKPAPDGLVQILDGRNANSALYVGDNVDDALAAQAARMPFVGVLPRGSEERRQRGTHLRERGALTILSDVKELEAFIRKRLGR